MSIVRKDFRVCRKYELQCEVVFVAVYFDGTCGLRFDYNTSDGSFNIISCSIPLEQVIVEFNNVLSLFPCS